METKVCAHVFKAQHIIIGFFVHLDRTLFPKMGGKKAQFQFKLRGKDPLERGTQL